MSSHPGRPATGRTICAFLLTTARDMADLPDRNGGHHDGPARRYFTIDAALNQVRTTQPRQPTAPSRTR